MKQINPPRRCEQCGTMFITLVPKRPSRMCSIPCRAIEQSARLRGKPQPLNAERRRRAGLVIQAAHLAEEFGGLTHRELRIADRARRFGYLTDYAVGYRSMPIATPEQDAP